MKLKKLFAGIVAVAMMATMGATSVFATETSVSPAGVNNGGQVPVSVKITGKGYESETVKLEFETTQGGKPTLVTKSSLTAESTGISVSIPATETNGVPIAEPTAEGVTTSTGTLHIQLPSYTRVGTYVYKFRQAAGNTAGMTYDSGWKYLMVNVYNELNDKGEIVENSNLKVNAVVLNADPSSILTATTTATNRDGLAALKIDEIDDTYESGTFSAKKLVKGNAADRDKEFDFKVTFTKNENATVSGKITVNGSATDENGNQYITFSGNTATYPFKLSHKQTINFANIPYGVTVNVVEMNGNDAIAEGSTFGDYTVTYNEDANADVKIGTKEGAKTTGAAVITNASTVNVDTGVILDNAPYIALLTIVAAGAVVMIMKKRRNYED